LVGLIWHGSITAVSGWGAGGNEARGPLGVDFR
jgi:hypothetical protein